MDAEEKNLLLNQIQTDVALISFLSVISVFFIGSLLPKFNAYDLSIKIPISFLIVSTFGFLLSALILSNTSAKIVQGDSEKVTKYLQYGYAISEYIGVYLFVLSIPLTINIITTDLYLRIVTFLSALATIALYQFMGFSLIEGFFSKSHRAFSVLTVLFGVALFTTQIYDFYFTFTSIGFLFFVSLVTFLAPRKDFQ